MLNNSRIYLFLKKMFVKNAKHLAVPKKELFISLRYLAT